MITKAHIREFRCIRELEIEFEPLTVLVGPNASGKSSVLEALAQTSSTVVRLEGRAEPVKAGPSILRVHQFALRELRKPNKLQAETALTRTGGNLANVLASLPRRIQESLAHDLCRVVDVLSDVDVRPTAQGQHAVVFQDVYTKKWMSPAHVSDGTMLMLAYLVMQYESGGPGSLGIEEPERGLHPYLIRELISLLRAITEGKHGRRRQFILATQSPEILDHVQPHEVRFLERDEDGGVKVSRAPTDDEAWPRHSTSTRTRSAKCGCPEASAAFQGSRFCASSSTRRAPAKLRREACRPRRDPA